MRKIAYALASAGTLAVSVMAVSTPATAQSPNLAPAVYPLGPSFAYWPAYYFYVPANRPAYWVDYGEVPSTAARYVLYDDVYPPAIYGPHLRPVPSR